MYPFFRAHIPSRDALDALEARILHLERELLLDAENGQLREKCEKDFWEFRKTLAHQTDPALRNRHIAVYQKYLQRFNSWIAPETIFGNVPVLPHGFHGIFISASATVNSPQPERN